MINFNHFLIHYGLDRRPHPLVKGTPANIMFIDLCRVRDKYDFIFDMAQAFKDYTLHVIDGFTDRPDGINIPRTHLISPPPEVYYRKNHSRTPLEINKNHTESEDILKDAASLFYIHLSQNNEYVDRNIIAGCTQTAYNFVYVQLKLANPKIVFLWNQFHPLSQAAALAANACGIKVIYLEYGVLPGTFNIDIEGQMGESWIANNPKRFNQLKISTKDIAHTETIISNLQRSGLNRRQQKPSDLDNLSNIVRSKAKERPVIFFAGHNDLASGMYPYTDRSKTFHSPNFESSPAAAQHVIDLAKKAGYYVLYKPHPFNDVSANIPEDADHVYCVGDININDCIDVSDVVCTVLSQVSYLALIRDKPLVLLGYNQMHEKNVAYEAYELSAIPDAFKLAIGKNGYEEQRKSAIQHIARLIKYYLYAWNSAENEEGYYTFSKLAERIIKKELDTEEKQLEIMLC